MNFLWTRWLGTSHVKLLQKRMFFSIHNNLKGGSFNIMI
jgi:hypothetical protein